MSTIEKWVLGALERAGKTAAQVFAVHIPAPTRASPHPPGPVGVLVEPLRGDERGDGEGVGEPACFGWGHREAADKGVGVAALIEDSGDA